MELDELDDIEPECECHVSMGRWDLDETVDASDCLLHGPRSEMARRQLQQEVDDNFAWAESMRPFFEGDGA